MEQINSKNKTFFLSEVPNHGKRDVTRMTGARVGIHDLLWQGQWRVKRALVDDNAATSTGNGCRGAQVKKRVGKVCAGLPDAQSTLKVHPRCTTS